MKFIALKTKDGELKGDIFFYCRILHVSRQGFYQYLANKDRPWNIESAAITTNVRCFGEPDGQPGWITHRSVRTTG